MRDWREHNTVGQVTNWLAEVGDLPTAMVMAVLGAVMLLDAIPLVGILVPGDVAVLGAMAARGPAGGAGVLFGVVAGCLAGWSATFLVGRYFGTHLRHSRVGDWIGEARWSAAERAVRRDGGRMVMVAPFLPVLNAIVPLAAGGLRMSYRRFLCSAAVGGALWAGCYVALGAVADALGGLLPGESFTMIASIVIGLSLGWVVLLGTRRRLARQGQPASPTDATDPAEGAGSAPPSTTSAGSALAMATVEPAAPARPSGCRARPGARLGVGPKAYARSPVIEILVPACATGYLPWTFRVQPRRRRKTRAERRYGRSAAAVLARGGGATAATGPPPVETSHPRAVGVSRPPRPDAVPAGLAMGPTRRPGRLRR